MERSSSSDQLMVLLAAVFLHEHHGGGVTALGGHLAQSHPVGDPDLHRLRLGGHAQGSSIAHGSRVRAVVGPGRTARSGWSGTAAHTGALAPPLSPSTATGTVGMVAQTPFPFATPGC